MTNLVVIPGGWPALADVEGLFGSTTDDEYEAQLKACRKSGHDLTAGFDAVNGREILTCQRCPAIFVESS